MIGQDKVAVPNKNSTEDQWNEVYDKLGRPESADKYSLDIKSDVVPFDNGAIKQFAENANDEMIINFAPLYIKKQHGRYSSTKSS